MKNSLKLIKKLKKCLLLLNKEQIEYEMIEKIIRSLKRKLEMGENPYKFKSNAQSTDNYLKDFLDF
jgi:hypothetical protein